jgi:hypothetical protein
VSSLRSSRTSPDWSNTQYQLDRSPKTNPIVSLCSAEFFACFSATVVIFFIVGVLYLLRFERVDNLGAYSIRPEIGLLIPYGYSNNQSTAPASYSNKDLTPGLPTLWAQSKKQRRFPVSSASCRRGTAMTE